MSRRSFTRRRGKVVNRICATVIRRTAGLRSPMRSVYVATRSIGDPEGGPAGYAIVAMASPGSDLIADVKV